MPPMTSDAIEQAIQQYVSDADTYRDSELAPDRIQATKYYRGDPFGNEEQGRSQFVSTDVRDAVLAILPSLVRLFVPTSGHIIEYQPRPKTPEEIGRAVELAQQATEFVNEIVLQQDNPGFLELHAAFKDALVRKVGVIKYWWEDRSVYKTYTAQRLDVNQYDALAQDKDVDLLDVKEVQVQGQPVFYDVDYKHWRREGIACLRCVPPEEWLVSRDARSRDDASFMGHKTELTTSQLLAMGVPQQEIDQYGGLSTEVRQSLEEIARRGGISNTDQAPNENLVKHLWIESYPYLDVDGDGEAELVRVRTLGPGYHLVGEPEPVDERPFACFCPDPEPHVLIGQSFADRVMDLQLMKSSIIRAAADGLADSIFSREYYMEGALDRQAMESTAIGQKIAVRDNIPPAQAVMTVSKEWKGQDALAFIGYLDSVKQGRTGPLPATLDPDSLQSTPEIGVRATVQAASEQVELIARVFAATGMQQLGRGLLQLLVEHQPRARLVRLRGTYVPVDPKAWDAEMDVAIRVALGTQEKLGVLAATAAKQEAILQQLGPANPLCTLGQLRNTYQDLSELQGLADVSRYWKAVDPDWTPPPPPAQPDPNMVLAQAETVKAQASLAKAEADFKVAQAKWLADQQDQTASHELQAARLQLDREIAHLTDARERDKAEANIALQVAQMNAQFGTQQTVAALNAQIEREKQASDERIAATKATPPTNGGRKTLKTRKTDVGD